MNTKQDDGFTASIPDSDQVEQALEQLITQFESDLEKLQGIMVTSAGRGEVDALLGQPCGSEEPSYKEAYERIRTAFLLASKEEVQAIKAMQPFLKELIHIL